MADPTKATTGYAGGQVSTGSYQNEVLSDDGSVNAANAPYLLGNAQTGMSANQWGHPDTSDITNWEYADPGAFTNYNAPNIYNVINQGINSRAASRAPVAALTALGPTSTMGAQQLAPGTMTGGANISPQMLVNAAQLNTGVDQQYAGAQSSLANQLYAGAMGAGPSMALRQGQLEAQGNIAGQMAAMANGRAGSAGLTAAQAANAAAAANQDTSAKTVLGRASEGQAYRDALSQVLGQSRGQGQTTAQQQQQLSQQALLANQGAFNSAAVQQAQLKQAAGLANQQTGLGVSGANATLSQQQALANQDAINKAMLQQGTMGQQSALANQQAGLSANQQNNDIYNQMLSAYLQQNQTDISNQAAYQQLASQEQTTAAQILAKQDINWTNNMLGLAGAGIGATGSMGMAGLSSSDSRGKTAVRGAGGELRGFLSELGYSF